MAATVSLSQYNPQANGALCSECPCAGLVVVPPERANISTPDAIFVGMEPGWEELRALRPFVGPSGRKVEALFKKHGLKRERMHITNAALCRSKKEEDRPAAFKCCAPRLVNEINSFPTSVPVVPLGAPAFQSVWGKKLPISLARGFLWNKDGRDVLPTLHPAFVLRESTQSPLISRDFRRAAKRIKEGRLELQEPTSFTVPRTARELRRALMSMQGDKLSIDIETSEDPPTLAEMICVGVSDIPPKHIAVIPWAPWVAPVLDPFVASRAVVTHNGPAFDQIVLKRYGVDVKKWDDTLIAHHVFAAHMRQGLDHVTSFYLDVEPWKIQFGKRASNEKGQPKLAHLNEDDLFFYNAKDVHHTALDWLAMHDDLWKHRKVYEFDKKTAEFCRHMQEQGALVDNERRRALSVAIKKKEKKLYKRMKKACGGDFAPTKTVDIRRILFKEFKAPVLDRTPKKLLPSTGKKTLAAFASMGSERPYGLFCKDLLEWRGCTKMRVTYLDNLKIEMDERTHPSWRSFGTIGGRLSCRKPNLTNLKRLDSTSIEPETRIREIYLAKPGYTFLSFDASQVEMRCAAYISQDPVFISSCESKDLHLANAKLIWGDIPELDDPKGKGKNYRDLAKNVGFAIAYLATPETVYEFIKAQGEKFKDVKYEIIVKVIDKIRRTFKVYYDFAQENYRFMQKHGFLKIGYVTGRIRWFDRYAAPTDIANAPVQTTAAEIIMGWLHTIFPKRSKGTNLIAQVHDQGIFEVPNKDVDKMEALIRSVCGEKVLLNNGVGYYQPIDVKRGRRWSDL